MEKVKRSIEDTIEAYVNIIKFAKKTIDGTVNKQAHLQYVEITNRKLNPYTYKSMVHFGLITVAENVDNTRKTFYKWTYGEERIDSYIAEEVMKHANAVTAAQQRELYHKNKTGVDPDAVVEPQEPVKEKESPKSIEKKKVEKPKSTPKVAKVEKPKAEPTPASVAPVVAEPVVEVPKASNAVVFFKEQLLVIGQMWLPRVLILNGITIRGSLYANFKLDDQGNTLLYINRDNMSYEVTVELVITGDVTIERQGDESLTINTCP